ncbi:BnaA08g05400D [Brassica napus]|uniref:BnaA08g05400D protein n=1 Tax=Brassica napus TaxID=3708 RepID=A0A078ID66_BRANA|nr:BnaA08g05400D [Brassica napus]
MTIHIVEVSQVTPAPNSDSVLNSANSQPSEYSSTDLSSRLVSISTHSSSLSSSSPFPSDGLVSSNHVVPRPRILHWRRGTPRRFRRENVNHVHQSLGSRVQTTPRRKQCHLLSTGDSNSVS